MISIKLYVLLVGAVVLIMLQTSNAIKCWDCDSYTNKFCEDPFDNRTASITDCSLIADRHKQKCRKIIQKLNGAVKFTRGCRIDDHNSNQLSEASIELCSTDACNAAPIDLPLILTVLSSFSILIGFNLMR